MQFPFYMWSIIAQAAEIPFPFLLGPVFFLCYNKGINDKGCDSMAKIRTAVLQTPVSEDAQENLDRVASLFDRDLMRSLDLVTLPEMFLCPYDADRFRDYAEPEGGPAYRFLSDLARDRSVYLSAGSVPELGDDGKVYNTAYVFDRAGNCIAKHRKMHLFDINIAGGQAFQESSRLSAGNQVTVFDTEFCKMGICICYDFRFPELARLMTDRGAKVLLCPAAFNLTTGPAHWELMFRSRAVDNQVYTIGTSPARNLDANYVAYGHSIVVDPWGIVISELEDRAQIRVVDLDLDRIDEVRDQLPLLKHRRKDIYDLKTLS